MLGLAGAAPYWGAAFALFSVPTCNQVYKSLTNVWFSTIAPDDIASHRTGHSCHVNRRPDHANRTQISALTQIPTQYGHDNPSRADDLAGGNFRSLQKIQAGPLSFAMRVETRNTANVPKNHHSKSSAFMAHQYIKPSPSAIDNFAVDA